MTHQPLTKAERDVIASTYDDENTFRLLADLDAAEAERDALRKIAEGCCNATDGGCSPGVSIEFLRDVPSEVEHIKRERDRLRKMPQSAFEAATFRELNAMEAQRDALKAKLAASDCRHVASEDSPRICTDGNPCGRHLLTAQCFDARQAWSKERDEVNALKAKLAESMAQELLTRSRAEEAHAIVAAMSMRPDLCHKPDCEVQKLRAWALGQKLPACDCGAWELQGRIEAMAIAAARGGATQ